MLSHLRQQNCWMCFHPEFVNLKALVSSSTILNDILSSSSSPNNTTHCVHLKICFIVMWIVDTPSNMATSIHLCCMSNASKTFYKDIIYKICCQSTDILFLHCLYICAHLTQSNNIFSKSYMQSLTIWSSYLILCPLSTLMEIECIWLFTWARSILPWLTSFFFGQRSSWFCLGSSVFSDISKMRDFDRKFCSVMETKSKKKGNLLRFGAMCEISD